MAIEVFLDTSFVIALAAPGDAHHNKAVELAQQLEEEGTHFLTTWGVLLEIGNALARTRYRNAAIELLDSIAADPKIEVALVSEDLCARALELFKSRSDKEWGLTDCLSFVVMKERGVTVALTADAHFLQAGFRAFLLES